jgi:hypothetical protein
MPLTPDAKVLPQPQHSAKEVELFLPQDRERLQEPREASRRPAVQNVFDADPAMLALRARHE